MVCLSHFGLIIHVSFQSRLYFVYVYGDLALYTFCPFKAGYVLCMCMVTWPYTPCVLSKQVIFGVCVWSNHWPCTPQCPYSPCYRKVFTNHQKVWKRAIFYISVVQRKSFNFKSCIGSQIFFMIFDIYFVALAPLEPGVPVALYPVWFAKNFKNCPCSPTNGYVCVCVCVWYKVFLKISIESITIFGKDEGIYWEAKDWTGAAFLQKALGFVNKV